MEGCKDHHKRRGPETGQRIYWTKWEYPLLNMSLQGGIVLLEWKEANIIPLFKKGSRNKSEKYWPVSLTSVICKLLETIIRDHNCYDVLSHKS